MQATFTPRSSSSQRRPSLFDQIRPFTAQAVGREETAAGLHLPLPEKGQALAAGRTKMKHNSRHVFGCSWGRAEDAIAPLLAIGPAGAAVQADQRAEAPGGPDPGGTTRADGR